jgi:hypothetical protein
MFGKIDVLEFIGPELMPEGTVRSDPVEAMSLVALPSISGSAKPRPTRKPSCARNDATRLV